MWLFKLRCNVFCDSAKWLFALTSCAQTRVQQTITCKKVKFDVPQSRC